MWCPRCHTDVAAEIAENGQSLLCTSCGTEIQRFYAPSLHPNTRSARDLLERWSKSDLLDPPEAVIGSETTGQPRSLVASSTPEAESTPAADLPRPSTPAEVRTPSVPAAPIIAATAQQPATPAPPVTPTVAAQVLTPPGAEAAPPESVIPDATTSRRAKPERASPKPRTVWRVDAAHHVTQPAPPPVPPRKPHFSATIGDEPASKAALPLTPPPQIPPAHSESVRTERPAPVTVAARPEAVVPPAPVFVPPVRAVASEAVTSRPVEPQEEFRPVIRGPRDLRLDPPHAGLSGPHFDLQAYLAKDGRKPGRAEAVWGQVLAYMGVGLITIGTTLVLWGWFGNTPQYAPTGWLVCTVGQMLLFLGVITLISGGMQQTSHEVTRRVEYLGDRMLRFEQSAEEVLRGPHFDLAAERARESKTARAENESA